MSLPPPDEDPTPQVHPAITGFIHAVDSQFDLALGRIEELWQDDLTVDAVTRLVNEAAVNLGVLVSIVEMTGKGWDVPVIDGIDELGWKDAFVSRLLSLAAAASIGARLAAPPEMTGQRATAWCFALMPGQLEHIPTDEPVRLHLFVLNAVGKLMRQQRLLEAAHDDDEDAITELVEINGSIEQATRSVMLLFAVVAGSALAAVYRLRSESPRYYPELDEPLTRPAVKIF